MGKGLLPCAKRIGLIISKSPFRHLCGGLSYPVHQQLSLTDGSTLSYDHLVLATGAFARPLPRLRMHLTYMYCAQLVMLGFAAGLANVRTALVIGGGYIGSEAAASLRSLDIDVHVVEMAPRLLARVASPALSEHCAPCIGMTFSFTLAQLRHRNRHISLITAVHLAGGQKLDTQLVMVKGYVPDTALAEVASPASDNGIVTADYLTPDPHISAIGDVARPPGNNRSVLNPFIMPSIAERWLPRGSQPSAAPSHEAWWFWSDQYDVKYQMAGLVPAYAPSVSSVTRTGLRENSMSVWSYDGAELVSVE